MESEKLDNIRECFTQYAHMTREELRAYDNKEMAFTPQAVMRILTGMTEVERGYCELVALSDSEREAREISKVLDEYLKWIIQIVPRTFVVATVTKEMEGRNGAE